MLTSMGLIIYGGYGLTSCAFQLGTIFSKKSDRFAWKMDDHGGNLWYFGQTAKIGYMTVWGDGKFIGNDIVAGPGNHLPDGHYYGPFPKVKYLNVQHEYLEFMRGTEFVATKPMAFPISVYYQSDDTINYLFDEETKNAYYFVSGHSWRAIAHAAFDSRPPFTLLTILVGMLIMSYIVSTDDEKTLERRRQRGITCDSL